MDKTHMYLVKEVASCVLSMSIIGGQERDGSDTSNTFE
jgi:hypothetical protein